MTTLFLTTSNRGDELAKDNEERANHKKKERGDLAYMIAAENEERQWATVLPRPASLPHLFGLLRYATNQSSLNSALAACRPAFLVSLCSSISTVTRIYLNLD